MHCAFKKHFHVKQMMYISMILIKCNLHFSISSQVKTHDQNACFQLRLKKYSSQKSICLGGESSNCKY